MLLRPTDRHPPAPLQLRMIRESSAWPKSGNHVEQLEIRFAASVSPDRVQRAWRRTVAATAALRMRLDENGPAPAGRPEDIRIVTGPAVGTPAWLAEDRVRPLLGTGRVPWRAVYQASGRLFIWTFHHALLDGRSITRIARAFADRIAGGEPGPLALARWPQATPEAVARAAEFFRTGPPPPSVGPCPESEAPGPSEVTFSAEATARLSGHAASLGITPATAILWSWGQALAAAGGLDAVWVEQVRAGAPQPGTAGFTMNLLPVAIPRAAAGDTGPALVRFREHLLALREIESVSANDFAPGLYPDLESPESSVIMIEREAPARAIGHPDLVERVTLHEPEGQGLTACAHLEPAVHLRVEGPGRHRLLDAWHRQLAALA